MLIDTLDDTRTYLKATLLQCLAEVSTEDRPIPATYKSILRREKQGIKAYTRVRRDPATGYRLYTGRDIRRILEYEIKRADEKSSGS